VRSPARAGTVGVLGCALWVWARVCVVGVFAASMAVVPYLSKLYEFATGCKGIITSYMNTGTTSGGTHRPRSPGPTPKPKRFKGPEGGTVLSLAQWEDESLATWIAQPERMGDVDRDPSGGALQRQDLPPYDPNEVLEGGTPVNMTSGLFRQIRSRPPCDLDPGAAHAMFESKVRALAADFGEPISHGFNFNIIVGRNRSPTQYSWYHGTNVYSAPGLLEDGLSPSTAVRRGDFKESLGRCLFAAGDLESALYWSQWVDLGKWCDPDGPAAGWYVSVAAVLWVDLPWDERPSTLVINQPLPVECLSFHLRTGKEVYSSDVWPALRKGLLPPCS
jgi:hypothetical protein